MASQEQITNCSFCNRKLHQTTAHCLTSGACHAFAQRLIQRHDEIVCEFVRFLCSRTLFKVVFKDTIIDPSIFKAGATLKHTRPDIVAQDPGNGDTIFFDVTVVMPSRMAHAYSDKTTRYRPMGDLAEDYCSRHSSPPAGFVSMPRSCKVVPLVFSVFGDMHDSSFSWCCDAVGELGAGENMVAPFLANSLMSIASCASAVFVASSKLYSGSVRRRWKK